MLWADLGRVAFFFSSFSLSTNQTPVFDDFLSLDRGKSATRFVCTRFRFPTAMAGRGEEAPRARIPGRSNSSCPRQWAAGGGAGGARF